MLFREQDPGIDDEDLAFELEDGHVATDLSETAERDDAERPGLERRRVVDV
jgi:hypothetical protein